MKKKAWYTFLFLFLAVLVLFSMVYTVSIGSTELSFSDWHFSGIDSGRVFSARNNSSHLYGIPHKTLSSRL